MGLESANKLHLALWYWILFLILPYKNSISLVFTIFFKLLKWPVRHLFWPKTIFTKQISQVEPPVVGQCDPVVLRGYLSGRMKTAKHKPPLEELKSKLFSSRVTLECGGRINTRPWIKHTWTDTSIISLEVIWHTVTECILQYFALFFLTL